MAPVDTLPSLESFPSSVPSRPQGRCYLVLALALGSPKTLLGLSLGRHRYPDHHQLTEDARLQGREVVHSILRRKREGLMSNARQSN